MPTFAGIGQHLSDLAARIQQVARRSRRFSWYSWGFLFVCFGSVYLASYLGSLYAVTVTTSTLGGVSVYTTLPWWTPLVGLAPPLAVLALGVREVVLGRRESERETASANSTQRATAEESPPNWTEVVQQNQKALTHSKSEVEWSFVPLILGFFGAVEVAIELIVQMLPPSPNPAIWVLVGPAIALPSLAMLWPLYRVARRWVGSFQTLLDRQVGEITRLEAEFLWRFGGAASTI